jgi:hypothetical protein
MPVIRCYFPIFYHKPKSQFLPYLNTCTFYLGPHKEGGYHQWLSSELTKRGWMLELQAPQGPYTNVLDLQVFPAMSKTHVELLQIFNNTEADRDRIWKIALEIWNGISSAMTARAFILAYRIMGKITEANGDTDWLKNGAPHCNVRRDYYDTDRGVKKITDVVDVGEDEHSVSQCY